MTFAERLGAEGRAEGRAEGGREARAEVIAHQLSLRFGALSGELRQRIQRADYATLCEWTDRVRTAASLDVALASPPPPPPR